MVIQGFEDLGDVQVGALYAYKRNCEVLGDERFVQLDVDCAGNRITGSEANQVVVSVDGHEAAAVVWQRLIPVSAGLRTLA